LHFLGFPWWNLAFSKGYQQKNKKIPFPSNSRPRLRFEGVSTRTILLLKPAEPDESIAIGLAWNRVFGNKGELNF
jgi:hypothetical protein